MIRAGRPERGQRFEILRIDELQHRGRVGEVANLALACGNMLANGGQELRRNIAPVGPGQRLDTRSAEGRSLRLCAEPSGGLVDHLQRDPIAFLRGRAPGEQPVAAEHHALHVRIGLGHRAELEPQIKARPLPGQKAKLAAIDLFRERFGVFARCDRNDRVRVNVIDMAVRNEAVQRCVDRGCARIEVEGAMIIERDHLVLVLEAAIDRFEAEELVEIERREAVELHRADVAAGTLDPENLGRRAGQRIGRGQLRGRVAAAEIGDAQVAAKQVRPIEQEARLIEGSRVLVVPEIGQWSVKTNLIAAHGAVPLNAVRFSALHRQVLAERQRFCAIARSSISDFDRARLTALEARGTESSNDQYRGNDKVMRERQRVEILRNLLAAQGFLSIADLMAATGVVRRVTEAA